MYGNVFSSVDMKDTLFYLISCYVRLSYHIVESLRYLGFSSLKTKFILILNLLEAVKFPMQNCFHHKIEKLLDLSEKKGTSCK